MAVESRGLVERTWGIRLAIQRDAGKVIKFSSPHVRLLNYNKVTRSLFTLDRERALDKWSHEFSIAKNCHRGPKPQKALGRGII